MIKLGATLYSALKSNQLADESDKRENLQRS